MRFHSEHALSTQLLKLLFTKTWEAVTKDIYRKQCELQESRYNFLLSSLDLHILQKANIYPTLQIQQKSGSSRELENFKTGIPK